MWSIQNITRIALMQLGVVIASILISGIYHKWSLMTEPHGFMPPYQNWWYQHGGFGFGFPIIWCLVSLYLYSRDEVADSTKLVVFWLGVLAVIVQTVAVVNSILNLFMPGFHIL